MGGGFVKGLAYLALLCLVALTSCQAAITIPVAREQAATART